MIYAAAAGVLTVALLFVVYLSGVRRGRRLRRSQADLTFRSMGTEYQVFAVDAPLMDRFLSDENPN